jgi:WhiB family redox-sensing transcriptional regulator
MAQPSAGAGRITNTQPRESQLPCRTGDPDLWFAENPTYIDQAKALCRECPVRAECLAGALERREVWGVWGGELLINGAIVAFKRGRGRPRKNAAA